MKMNIPLSKKRNSNITKTKAIFLKQLFSLRISILNLKLSVDKITILTNIIMPHHFKRYFLNVVIKS